MADDDDIPQLSSAALAALTQFYQEEQDLSDQFQKLKDQAEDKYQQGMKLFKEDWQLSQFWYDEATSEVLAKEVLSHCTPSSRVACISCPTAFTKLMSYHPESHVVLLEYDKRFDLFGDNFAFYDYKSPVNLPADKLPKESFDYILLDPPFLSDECFIKVCQTVRFLSKKDAKVLICSGLVMKELVGKIFKAQVCEFRPHHANNLSNDFRCYTSYQSELMKWE